MGAGRRCSPAADDLRAACFSARRRIGGRHRRALRRARRRRRPRADRAGWSPRTLAFALGAMFCVPGALWLIIQYRWNETPAEGQPDGAASAEEEVLEGRVG